MANQPGTSFNPKASLTYARSITAAQVNSVTPVGFATGGRDVLVYNSGAVPVMFYAYNSKITAGTPGGLPTMVFPVDGTPPTGQPGTVVPPGAIHVIGIRADADSFTAIGQAAGPSVIYVQRGEGL
jgi:hypothetical protein